MVFRITFSERLKQFLCKHNYFAVAMCDNFQEPSNHNNQEDAIFYRCEKCLHLRVVRK